MAVRLIRVGIVVAVVLVIGVAGVIGVAFRDHLPGSARNLQVGDCFEVPTADQVGNVQHRPCTEPHDGEVFVVRNYMGTDAYPSHADFDAWVDSQCLGADFEAYVGATYDSRQDLSVGYLYPLQDRWQQGDRAMTCYLSPAGGGTVSSSYRKAGG